MELEKIPELFNKEIILYIERFAPDDLFGTEK